MRNTKVRLLMSIVVMFCIMASHSAWAAPKWYEYYTEAQQASDKNEWERAIEFYLKAIKEDPVPDKKKSFGMRSITYYPYLGAGMAYLAIGKMEEALTYCQLAQEKKVEPQKPVSECVAIASKYVKAAPQTAPTAPPTPQTIADGSPSLSLTSPPPERTDEKIVDFRGIASSANGIKEINVSVENLGTTTISRFEMTKQQEESFWIGVPLYFGQNNITIEAVDMNAQTTAERFSIIRNRSGEAVAAEATATPAVKRMTPTPSLTVKSTPTPFPPVAGDDATIPTITLTSKIPGKTDAQELEISGVANDAGGMSVVRISSGRADAKGLILSSAESSAKDEQQTQLSFQQSISLEPGANLVKIEAIDVQGNVATREMTIVRTEASGGTTEIAASNISGQRYAVIIGISVYQDERLNLRYTVNDAQGLFDVLTDPMYGAIPKENVQLLLSEQATTANIKKALNGLRRKSTPDDTVIIYYSGHGAQEEDQTYWVTYDADIDDLLSTALNSNDIRDMLDRISSKQLITFLDSCYSAATVKRTHQSRSVPTEVPWEKFTGEGRVMISASNGKELSLELDEYRHGVFTYYLLEGLKGKADLNQDGYVEVEEIWDFVKRQVQDKARAEGNKQTPMLQGELSAGIALTMNAEAFKKKTVETQIQQLEQLFYDGKIDATKFDCAVRMLSDGKSNRALESLLKGDLSPQTFNQTFRCE
ncbi:polysaccharide deacetylase [Candidatus Moduliflexus flocculans]|uniref:Polysaccharide deacetylase n=1 Tax=Candidatus Moduliflexus flocculans TaxID=1499966 RepID=A0A0S6VSF8_9BACT|nr:polysaccharide deacetylase [Candidatus Moduliflexus flocculans]